MVLADGQGVPLGVSVHSASPAEVRLAEETLRTVSVGDGGRGHPRQNPERLIVDRGYDSDRLRDALAARGIEQICPHRKNRRRPKRQDGRALRRYRNRWKVERSIAWIGNYRRLAIRWDRDVHIFRAFVHISCAIITCRYL
jgi:transposase